MKLTQEEIRRLRSWKENEFCEQDKSRKNDEHLEPMLPKVAFSIVSSHMHKRKTAIGKLRACIKACGLVIEILETHHEAN